jgi:hypothetical protein
VKGWDAGFVAFARFRATSGMSLWRLCAKVLKPQKETTPNPKKRIESAQHLYIPVHLPKKRAAPYNYCTCLYVF